MAQQVEHVLGKDEVTGSNPVSSSIKTTIYGGFSFVLITIYSGVKSAKNFGCQNTALWLSESHPIFTLSDAFRHTLKNSRETL